MGEQERKESFSHLVAQAVVDHVVLLGTRSPLYFQERARTLDFGSEALHDRMLAVVRRELHGIEPGESCALKVRALLGWFFERSYFSSHVYGWLRQELRQIEEDFATSWWSGSAPSSQPEPSENIVAREPEVPSAPADSPANSVPQESKTPPAAPEPLAVEASPTDPAAQTQSGFPPESGAESGITPGSAVAGTPQPEPPSVPPEQQSAPTTNGTAVPTRVGLRPVPRRYSAPGIAALLLDVENLGLEPAFLLHLHSISDRPIQIRLAFGNWRRISAETEQFLLAEGFELIQTPQGANLADMKMTAVGAGLLLRWPTLGEVFVCSSDGDLDFLCTALVQQGLQVWRVRHHRDYLISDLVRQQHHVFVPERTDAHTREAFPSPPPADGIPLKHPAHGFHTEEQLALYLRELIQEVQRTQPQSALHGISVNHLANLFSQRFGGPLNLLLKGVPSGTTLTAFLRKHRAFGFELEQSQKNTCLVRLQFAE